MGCEEGCVYLNQWGYQEDCEECEGGDDASAGAGETGGDGGGGTTGDAAGPSLEDLDLPSLINSYRGVTYVDQDVLDVGFTDPESVLAEASIAGVEQVFDAAGGPAGFQWTTCPTDSLCDLLGFQVDDIVVSANGYPLTTIPELFTANSALVGATTISVTVERGTGATTLAYRVVN